MGINKSTLLRTIEKVEKEIRRVEAFLSEIKKITNETKKYASYADIQAARKNASLPDIPAQDMIEAMRAENLQLLELQAMMQSNMQTWTTKSNILSADHRARMRMIEKFSAR